MQGLAYHHHDVSIFYDEDGSRYHLGRGLSIFVDHRRVSGPGPLAPTRVNLPQRAGRIAWPSPAHRDDLAVNPGLPEGPVATASSTDPEAPAGEAIDGRLWFFPEIANGWSPSATDTAPTSWYQIDLRTPRTIGCIELYLFADGDHFLPPTSFHLQSLTDDGWEEILDQTRAPSTPLANGKNRITFAPIRTEKLRMVFANPASAGRVRLIEVKVFAP